MIVVSSLQQHVFSCVPNHNAIAGGVVVPLLTPGQFCCFSPVTKLFRKADHVQHDNLDVYAKAETYHLFQI